jgi:murein DD-endopeptidase MepM/ murein hydrolase activator NlpD
MISKLIWSRGRLGKPLADFVVITATFLVFLVGGVFNSNKFVNSASANPDVFKNTPDYIPQYQSTLLLVPEERKRNETIRYTVQEGDTLFSIGQKYKISADAIRYINNLADADTISIGQVLSIPPISGIIHKVKSGDTLATISKLYDVPSQAIADFNYLTDLSSLQLGSELVIPDAKIPQVAQAPSSQTTLEQVQLPSGFKKGWCRWPSSSRIITQYFSWYHSGLDIATSWFSAMPPIFACAGGKVIRAGWDPTGYGIMVMIDHGNGYQTLYGHLSKLKVSYGDYVNAGEQIGIMGNTGRSTGPHLHFEVRRGTVRQNPLNHVFY